MTADFDVAWMVLGLFLLACGGVPAGAALVAERRERLSQHSVTSYASADPASRVFHEAVLEASSAELEGIRHALAALDSVR